MGASHRDNPPARGRFTCPFDTSLCSPSATSRSLVRTTTSHAMQAWRDVVCLKGKALGVADRSRILSISRALERLAPWSI
jgi:hypothetical protein